MLKGEQAERALRKVEKDYLDVFYQQYRVLKRPRDTALIHILCSFEIQSFLTSASELRRGHVPSSFGQITYDKEALRHALLWVCKECPLGGDASQDTDHDIMVEVAELLSFARDYAMLWDVHVCIGHGLFDVRYDEAQNRFTFYHKADRTGIASLWSTVQRSEQKPDLPVVDYERDQFRNVLANAAKQIGPSKLEIDWNVVEAPEVRAFARAAMSPYRFELPEDWELGGYSLGEYREAWAAMVSIAWLSHLLHLFANKLGVANTLCVDSCVPAFAKSHWIHWIARLSSMKRETVAAILADLTYDSHLKNPDPSLQPFIPLSEEKLALSVVCLITSNTERNLMKILSRKPGKKHIYDGLSQEKETIFLNEVSPVLDSIGLRHLCRTELQERGKLLTDIDLLLWEEKTGTLLVVELKWLIPPDEVIEVVGHDTEFESAIVQVSTAIDYLAANLSDFLDRHWKSVGAEQVKSVKGMVVSHDSAGTGKMLDPRIPVVEWAFFREMLEKHGQKRLDRVHSLCRKRPDVKRFAGQLKHGEREIHVGDYTYVSPVAEIQE